MADLIELQTQRAALAAARATGALRTTFRSGGTERTIEYKSDAQMAAALAALDRDIALFAGPRIHTFYPHFSKGL